MGSWLSADERKRRQDAEDELREQREQMQQQEQNHREELERNTKIGKKRIKLLKTKPGESDDFPRDVDVPRRLFISLFGEPGTGKTSLINSLKYVVNDGLKYDKRIPSAAQDYQGAHTKESLEFVLTNHLSVIDNPGINCEKAVDVTKQDDVIRRMGGKYETGTVTWQSLAPGHVNEEDKKSYCSVMVFSAENTNVARGYRKFIHRLRDWQGRFPLAVITHVDKDESDAVRLALEAGGIGDIFDVSNIFENGRDYLSHEHQLQLLQLLRKCFRDGDSIFLRRQEVGNGE